MQEIKLEARDVVLSSSSIKDLQSCWRKHFYRNEPDAEGNVLVPRRTAPPLQLGDAFHRGLQGFYSGLEPKEILRQTRELFAEQSNELDEENFEEQCQYNSIV